MIPFGRFHTVESRGRVQWPQPPRASSKDVRSRRAPASLLQRGVICQSAPCSEAPSHQRNRPDAGLVPGQGTQQEDVYPDLQSFAGRLVIKGSFEPLKQNGALR